MPGVVYLKEAHDTTRTELVVGDIVEEMVVSDLKAAIERKTAIPVAEQVLLYAGRVLKQGKRLQHYKIVSGVTVFVLRKRANPVTTTSDDSASLPVCQLLLNHRIQQLLTNVFQDPLLLQRMLRGTELENSHQLLNNMLQDPAFRNSIGDTNSLLKYLGSHSKEATLMGYMLQACRNGIALERGCAIEEVTEDELVELLERSVEDLEDGVNIDEDEEETAMEAQEQLYQHGQQQQHQQLPVAPSPHGPVSAAGSASQSSGLTTITQNMLASALSSALQSSPSSQSSSLASLYGGPGTPLSSNMGGPSSLPARPGNSSGPSSLQVPGQPSLSRLPSWPSSSPGSSAVERASSGPSSLSSGHPASSPVNPAGAISQQMLSEALHSVISRQQAVHVTPPTTQSTVNQQFSPLPPPLPPRRQPSPQQSLPRQPSPHRSSPATHRFHSQVQQLRQMGIMDEAACLHALEATNGDVEAAIGLLL